MKSSTDRILTTHVGSLPRSQDVLKLIHAKTTGTDFDAGRYEAGMRKVVADSVRRQADVGSTSSMTASRPRPVSSPISARA